LRFGYKSDEYHMDNWTSVFTGTLLALEGAFDINCSIAVNS